MMAELTDLEAKYIREKYQTVSVTDMAKHLGRGTATIYSHMKAKGMKPFVYKVNNRGKKDHPFRLQNRKLENYSIARKEKAQALSEKK